MGCVRVGVWLVDENDLVAYFFDKYLYLFIQDTSGRTALHMTAIHGFYLRTETLIAAGN